MTAERPAVLTLTRGHVERFAQASGDRNPLHLDSEFARTTPYGVPIAHGSLVALGMLGFLLEDELARVRALRITFARPVAPDVPQPVEIEPGRPGEWQVRLRVHAEVGVQVRTYADAAAVSRALRPAPAMETTGSAPREMPNDPGPDDLHVGATLTGVWGAGPVLTELAAALGAGALRPALLDALAWVSYVVGMEWPGTRSLLAGVVLSADAQAGSADGFAVGVRNRDHRTGLLVLDARSGPAGQPGVDARIDCFALSAPEPPPALHDPPPPERGPVAVIGASRGFGAALTLALLGRGYRVHALSRGSAAVAELERLSGPARDRLHPHTADAADADAMARLADGITLAGPLAGLVLSAALPVGSLALTAATGGALSEYVQGSLGLAAVPLGALMPGLADRAWVLIMSSVAVDDPPRDWPHYVSAKAALEGLAGWLAAVRPDLRILVLRAPGMRTAMTATPGGHLAAVDPVAVASSVADRVTSEEFPAGVSLIRVAEAREAVL